MVKSRMYLERKDDLKLVNVMCNVSFGFCPATHVSLIV
jgi:hypothetical protein